MDFPGHLIFIITHLKVMQRIIIIVVMIHLVLSIKAQITPEISIDRIVDTLVGQNRESASLEIADSIVVSEDEKSDKQTMFLLRESDILIRLNSLPIYTWNEDVRHIRPLAQDFNKLFDGKKDDDKIQVEDAVGVSLAGIKAISRDLKHYDLIIVDLQKTNDELARKYRSLERVVDKQRKELEYLKRQMADLTLRVSR